VIPSHRRGRGHSAFIAQEAVDPNSEDRKPKSERNPKPERLLFHPESNALFPREELLLSALGFRISFRIRISDFGFQAERTFPVS
jgi:hypothetical protein